MGIIGRQAILGSVFIYIGVVLGFITTTILMPRYLDTDEIGLLSILVAYASVVAQFATLGFPTIVNRLFPYFRNNENGHNGFLFYMTSVGLFGFLLFLIFYFIFKEDIILRNSENPLFGEYIFYVVPLSLFFLFFGLFDSYSKAIYNAVVGTLYKELFQRVFIMISIVIYAFGFISFPNMVFAYILSLSLPTLMIVLYLIRIRQFDIKPPKVHVDRGMVKEMVNVGFFGIIAGVTSIFVLQVDRIMVNDMLGLSDTGIYTTTFLFGTLIIMPSRPLRKIATSLVADAMKEGDMKKIEMIHQRSSLNQFLLGSLLFLGIWGNIDSITGYILPPEFEKGRYVILFICLMNLVEMLSGVPRIILVTSNKYRVATYVNIVFLALLVLFNYLFIRYFGLIGASIGSFVTMIIFQVIIYVYIYKQFKVQAFSIKHLYIVGVSLLVLGLNYFLPKLDNYIYDLFYRSFIIAFVFLLLAYLFKLSEELNGQINNLLSKVGPVKGS